MRPGKARQRAFTYLVLLWWIAISGVMLAALGRQWSQEAQRQREAELVFRAEQIVQALQAYRLATPEGQVPAPASLSELLSDQRAGQPLRHLRQVWPDPITGQPWGLIVQGGRITGVHSTSTRAPLAGPPGALQYLDWRFDGASVVPPIQQTVMLTP